MLSAGRAFVRIANLRFDDLRVDRIRRLPALVLFCATCWPIAANAQPGQHVPVASTASVRITVTDENGSLVPGAQVTILESSHEAARLWTDYAGTCTYVLQQRSPYQIHVDKA